MENVSVEVIVGLFARYQLYHFWFCTGIVLSLIFVVAALFFWIASLEYEPVQWVHIVAYVFTLCFIASIVTAIKASYLTNVVLKPEIAGYVVPVGLEAVGEVSKEIHDMLDILKGVISK